MSSVDVKCRRNCPRLPAILSLAVFSEDFYTRSPTQAFPLFIPDLLFFYDSLLAFTHRQEKKWRKNQKN